MLEIIIFKIAIIVLKKMVTDSQQILLFPITLPPTHTLFAPKEHDLII